MSDTVTTAFWSDRLNPMVVRELRQAMRGRFISVLLIIYLITQLLFLFQFAAVHDGGIDFGGESLMFSFLAVLYFATIVLIPMAWAARVSSERMDDLDLLYVTTLPPNRIITGKFNAGMIVILLFFSATLPFMSLTFLLRGVDLPTVLALTIFGLAVSSMVLAGTLMLACLPLSRILRVLLGLVLFVSLCFVMGTTMALSIEMTKGGVGQIILSGERLWESFGFVAFTLAVLMVLKSLATALIQPASMNRAFRVRVMLTVLWLVGFIFSILLKDLDIWIGWSIYVLVMAMVIAPCERGILNHRLRSSIPKSRLKRVLVFPFYSGVVNGYAWAILLSIPTLILSLFELSDNDFMVALGICAFALAYSLTAFALVKMWLGRFISQGLNWVVVVALVFLVLVMTFVMAFLIYGSSWDSGAAAPLFALTPFGLASNNSRSISFVVGVIWAIASLMFSAPWFLRSFKDFKPIPERVEPVLAGDQAVSSDVNREAGS